MSSNAGNSTNNTPRKGRRPKTASTSITQDTNTVQNPTIHAPTPIRTERRRRPNKRPQPNDIPAPDQQPQSTPQILPSTPPRATAQENTSAAQFQPESMPTPSRNTRSKKIPNKHAGNVIAPASTPVQRKSRSPHPAGPSPSSTPIKSSTPVQAYAGPTFHASPAPSALPIPKFFSKSVPMADKGTSLKAMMQDDSSEGSSNKSGNDSPTLKDSLQVLDQPVREASPLDMFFKADREEKAKRRSLGINGTPNQSSENIAQLRDSVSPIPDYMRPKAEQNTGGSMNNMFAMEMEASEKASSVRNPDWTGSYAELQHSELRPTVVTSQASQNEERARAKSIALKNLLYLPLQQSATPQSVELATPTSIIGSPPSNSSPRHSYNLRSTSASSSPRSIIPRHDNQDPLRDSRQFPIDSVKASAQQRPSSSHLRQETVSDIPNELPTTPKISRAYDNVQSTSKRNNHNVQLNNNTFSSSPAPKKFNREDALKAATREPMMSVDMMENELKRILKLNVLGGDGVTGVRS